MSIMALVGVLTVGGFVSIRTQSEASNSAEELLSAIRDAQNKAVSVQKHEGAVTKVWALEVKSANSTDPDSNYFRLNALDQSGTTLTANPLEKVNLPRGVTIKSFFEKEGTKTEDTGTRFISFNSPFGKTFTSQNICAPAIVGCTWSVTDPAEEWVISGATGMFNKTSIPGEKVRFEINYGSSKPFSVVINENGESYIE